MREPLHGSIDNYMTIKRKNIVSGFLGLLFSLVYLKNFFVPIIIKTLLCFFAVCMIVCLAFALDADAQLSGQDSVVAKPKVEIAHLSVEPQSLTLQKPHRKRANFEHELASQDARYMANWIVNSGDNRGMPFVIVDKVDAKVFVFYADGRLRGSAPALLGMARGDDAVPGIGNRDMKSIRPEERTTPAGRFMSYLGVNFYRKDILWVDYEGAVSLHRVVTNKPEERRLERLATPTPLDNRISYGCINVPAQFFDKVVKPSFKGVMGVVYVLPEIKSKKDVFASYYDVE